MVSVALSIIVPIAIYSYLPRWLQNLGYKPAPKNLLAAACVLYFVSFYLPTFHIEGQDTSFATHFVGGGLFSGFLWLYLKQSLRWKMLGWLELISLYLLVSGLGVANELFELLIEKTGITYVGSWDTWWDLLANSLGALAFWLVYKFVQSGRHF